MGRVWIENNSRMEIVYSAPSMSYGTAFERFCRISVLQTATQLGSKQARVSVACPGGTQSDEARLEECATECCPHLTAISRLANSAPALARRGSVRRSVDPLLAMSSGSVLVRGDASPRYSANAKEQDGRPFAFPSSAKASRTVGRMSCLQEFEPVEAGSAHFGNTQTMTGRQT